MQKIQVRKLGRIPKIPQHTRSRAALDIARSRRMKRERRSSTGDHMRDKQSLLLQFSPQLQHGTKRSLALRGSFDRVALVNVAVISVQSCRLQMWRLRDQAIQLDCLCARSNTGPSHSAIDVEEQIQLHSRCV